MRDIVLFLQAYLKNDFTASLLISSGKKMFVTIRQQVSANCFCNNVMKKSIYIQKFGEQHENDKLFLYTVDLGNVWYDG